MKPNLNVNPHMNSQKIWIAVSLTIIVAVGAIVGASILITPKSNSVTCCVTTSRSTSSMSSTKSAPVELPIALCCTTSTSTSPSSTSSSSHTTSSTTSSSTTSSSTTSQSNMTLNVNSASTNSQYISGYQIILYQNGQVTATGFTPVSFSLVIGDTYAIQADNYGSCTFAYWDIPVTGGYVQNYSNPMTFTATSSLTPLPVMFNCGTTSSTTSSISSSTESSTSTSKYSTSSGFSGDITVYAHRIPSSYWAPCFALVCSAGTGPGVTMYFALFDSAGNVVQTGFANENGYNFTGLNPSASYYVYASNCDSCHGASHDVNFSHWGNGATAQELEVSAGQSVDAWYVYIPLNSSTTSTGTSGNYIATNSSVVSVIGIIAAMAIPAIISRRHGFLRLNNAKNH